MVELGLWVLAAIFFAVTCIVCWFFLKLFFRFLLVVIAVSFLLSFLYQYSLLPESISKQLEEAFFRAQKLFNERVEISPSKKNKEEEQRKRFSLLSRFSKNGILLYVLRDISSVG